MAAGILLESGTNEMELLVFSVGDTDYGINVAKVREIIRRTKTIHIPNSPAAVEGSFRLREEVLTLIDLGAYLDKRACIPSETPLDDDYRLIIVIEFNDIRCGVLVDKVEMIHRLRWEQIEPPSEFLQSQGTPVTAVARINDRVVLVLDFETVVGQLLGSDEINVEPVQEVPEVQGHTGIRVLVADDSVTIRDSVERVLQHAGFSEITLCGDGQQAWDTIVQRHEESGGLPYELVLTDVEMPRMDGLHLTARIKEHPELKAMPVVLFSSLMRGENMAKGEAVGADAQVTKFKRDKLIEAIDACLAKVGIQR